MRRELWHSFSTCGLLLGTLFFAASLTPSLLPRSYLTQGVLSGLSLGGRVRHRRVRRLALGLSGAPAARGLPAAPRQACCRGHERDRCERLPLAGGTMAEFDPR